MRSCVEIMVTLGHFSDGLRRIPRAAAFLWESVLVLVGGKHGGIELVNAMSFGGRLSDFRYPTVKPLTAEIAEFAERSKNIQNRADQVLLGELGVLGG
jgi:hypothetical protein